MLFRIRDMFQWLLRSQCIRGLRQANTLRHARRMHIAVFFCLFQAECICLYTVHIASHLPIGPVAQVAPVDGSGQ